MRAHTFSLLPIAAASAVAFLNPIPAMAVQKSGTVIAVEQATAASGVAGDRMLLADAPVFMGDTIRTWSGGEAQIQLLDDTKLVVGPNSFMTVDDFVFSGGKSAQKVTLNAVRGAFRFITGASHKDAYTIKTPTATIGVRGTRFDFSIGRRGEMNLALFEGEARICKRWNQCLVVSGPCSIAVAQRFRPVRPPASPDERNRILAAAFPFVASQANLDSAFRVDTSACSAQRADIQSGGAAPVLMPARSGGSGGSTFYGGAAPAPAVASSPGQGNNGFGNGGEGSEGSTETGNPGKGGGPNH